MEAPLSVILIIFVTIAVFSVAFFLLSRQVHYPVPPVSMNIPTSQVVYRDRNVYYIPVRISLSDNAPPIRICSVNIRLISQGTLLSETVDLLNAVDGVPVRFSGGTITFQSYLITKPMSQTITVVLNTPNPDDTRLLSMYVYYCIDGENIPRWGEELRIPDRHLTP